MVTGVYCRLDVFTVFFVFCISIQHFTLILCLRVGGCKTKSNYSDLLSGLDVQKKKYSLWVLWYCPSSYFYHDQIQTRMNNQTAYIAHLV